MKKKHPSAKIYKGLREQWIHPGKLAKANDNLRKQFNRGLGDDPYLTPKADLGHGAVPSSHANIKGSVK